MAKPAVPHYSTLQIGLHWAIAALVMFQIVFGEAMVRFVDAAEEGGAVSATDTVLANAHYWSGIAILALLVARIGLRLFRGVPPHDPSTSPLAAFLASAMHWAFYALLIAVPVSGLVTYYGLADIGDIHGLAKPVFVVLVAGHAGAALFHQFVKRDGTLARMLPVIGQSFGRAAGMPR